MFMAALSAFLSTAGLAGFSLFMAQQRYHANRPHDARYWLACFERLGTLFLGILVLLVVLIGAKYSESKPLPIDTGHQSVEMAPKQIEAERHIRAQEEQIRDLTTEIEALKARVRTLEERGL